MLASTGSLCLPDNSGATSFMELVGGSVLGEVGVASSSAITGCALEASLMLAMFNADFGSQLYGLLPVYCVAQRFVFV